MLLSWASLYGYLSARTTVKIERVAFIIDPVALTLQMSINGDDAKDAPLNYHELEPLLQGFVPTLGVPESADVQKGTVEIDYVANVADVTVYYIAPDGNKQRTERRFEFF